MINVNLTRLWPWLLIGGLIGCSSGGSDDASSGSILIGSGSILIAITDAPVNDASAVVVQFSGVTLKPQSGDPIQFDFSPPLSIDLVPLTGGVTKTLLNDSLPAGQYDWVRLNVNATFNNVFDSYAMVSTGMVELEVPSGSQTGLQLVHGFTITANQTTSFVIDWDLNRALTDPPGQIGIFLLPALRITDMTEFGTLNGTVAMDLVTDSTCTNDLVLDTGNAVYLFDGLAVVADDIDDADPEPIATAAVTQNQAGDYTYEVSFLSPGNYTAAVTCQANDDDPAEDTVIAFPVSSDAIVVDGQTTTVDF